MAQFKMGLMTLKSLFSKPATKLYPIERPEYFERTKGHVEIDVDACKFCGNCANLCPTGALEIDRKAYTWSIDRFRCIQCRNCVEVCPAGVLTMSNTYAAPASEHTVTVYEISAANRAQREAEAAERAAKAAKLREEALAKKKAAEEKAAAEKAKAQ